VNQLFSKLNELRKEKEWSDIVIVAGDERIPCHKVVVAALSPRIKKHLAKDSSTAEIRLDDVDPEILAQVFKDFYALRDLKLMTLDAKTIPVCLQLGISLDVIVSCIWSRGPLALFRMASDMNSTALRTAVIRKLAEDFELWSSDSILRELSKEELIQVISRDDLHVHAPLEFEVFRTVEKWAEMAPANEASFMDVVQHVRLNQIGKAKLHDMLAHRHMSNPVGRRMIQQALRSRHPRVRAANRRRPRERFTYLKTEEKSKGATYKKPIRRTTSKPRKFLWQYLWGT
jgi:hypothetical protein